MAVKICLPADLAGLPVAACLLSLQRVALWQKCLISPYPDLYRAAVFTLFFFSFREIYPQKEGKITAMADRAGIYGAACFVTLAKYCNTVKVVYGAVFLTRIECFIYGFIRHISCFFVCFSSFWVGRAHGTSSVNYIKLKII